MHKRTVVEEHIVLITEPKSLFVGHFTTATESSQSVNNGILDYFAQNKVSFGSVAAVGREVTAVKIGNKGSAFKSL